MAMSRTAAVWAAVAAVGGLCVVVVVALVVELVAFLMTYGADFDHPGEVPVPPAATLLAHDESSDDDDPLRSRQQVLEIPEGSKGDVLAFYREQFPSSDGWRREHSGPGQELCLVNRSRDGYTEILDVLPYAGTRVNTAPGRYLVVMSRIEHVGKRPCGAAESWISLDLLG